MELSYTARQVVICTSCDEFVEIKVISGEECGGGDGDAETLPLRGRVGRRQHVEVERPRNDRPGIATMTYILFENAQTNLQWGESKIGVSGRACGNPGKDSRTKTIRFRFILSGEIGSAHV